MKRGEIWWADLGEPRGSGPGYRRPVLVIQADSFNDSGISTVLVATITSRIKRADAPGNVEISEADSGLPRRSVVNVSQIVTVDRTHLIERVGSLPGRKMDDVNAGLCMILGLR